VKFTTADVKRLYDTLVKRAPEAAVGVVAAFLSLLFLTTTKILSDETRIIADVIGAAFAVIAMVSFAISIYFISSARR
jgi:mRNA-degrading endonuclease HigB of HigAB toxin-antitoxin module